MMNSFFSSLTTLIMALLAMAFYTLLERKYLGYSQLRKGPNKVSMMAILQPIADALKLFSKESMKPTKSNFTPFMMAPTMSLALAMMMWLLAPSEHASMNLPFSVVMFLCISSLSVYTTLAAGWTSNSKYSLIGSMRSVAQTISYEVSMSITLLFMLVFVPALGLMNIVNQSSTNMIIVAPMLAGLWFITTLAETNRSPFDLAEGESEIVSGFNTEYSSNCFAAIFMAEYLNILFMSLLSSIILMKSLDSVTWMDLSFKTSLFAIMFLWVRTSYPRMRYDQLMSLTWTSFLPLSLSAIMMGLTLFFL